MATSLQFPSNHHTENHQTQQAQAMNQTSTGRRRSSKNSQKKKKQPQRGMGVEQLERLRVQDHIKNSNIHVGHHHQYYSNSNFPNFPPLSAFTGGSSTTISASGAVVTDPPGIYSNSILNSSPVLQFPKLCPVSPNDFFMQQKVVNTGFVGSTSTNQLMICSHDHQFQSPMNLYGFSTSKLSTEKSKELYSVPNLFSSNNSCFSDRCRSCNKKKRMINGEEISIHMEDMIRDKEDFGTKPSLLHPYSLPTRLEKGVEIVAIHRKGSSSVLSSEEAGAVVMEYDFFPAKIGTNNYTSCFENEATMMTAYNSPESSSVAAAAAGNNINGEASSVTTISWAADTISTPTSSIDLSLKLSC